MSLIQLRVEKVYHTKHVSIRARSSSSHQTCPWATTGTGRDIVAQEKFHIVWNTLLPTTSSKHHLTHPCCTSRDCVTVTHHNRDQMTGALCWESRMNQLSQDTPQQRPDDRGTLQGKQDKLAAQDTPQQRQDDRGSLQEEQ